MELKKYLILILLIPVILKTEAPSSQQIYKQDVEDADEQRLLEDKEIKRKSDQAQGLVTKAVSLIKKQGMAASCKEFMDDLKWRIGEIYVWIFDSEGNCYCRGFEKDRLWKKFGNEKGEDYIKRMLDIGKQGGFIDYKWDNGYSRAYIKNITIGKKTFIVGAGLYPVSSVYVVRELISSAEHYLRAASFVELKERINNPTGVFVRGNIHLEVYSFDGVCVANGDQLALIGQNLLDAKTGDGKFIVRDMIQIAKTKGEGWYDFVGVSGNQPARVFVKKIVDPKTNTPYVLSCSYYAGITEKTVMDLVKDAADFLKANGREVAFREFNTQLRFTKGDVTVFVYDMKGNMVADGRNPAFVGLNLINTRDSEGRFVARQILDMANTYGKGWVSNALSNSYQVAYCEKVSVPDGDFVIGASYFPVLKESYVRFMIDDAILYLQHHSVEESFLKFRSNDGGFIRGDISIFVYTMDGICLVDGNNLNKIWSRDSNARDDKGVRVLDHIIGTAKTGGGWLKFNLNNAVCNIYVKALDKADEKSKPEMYIVGSGYYE